MKHPVPILLYHSIGTEASHSFRRWVVPPAQFEQQMRYLHQQQYTALTVTDFVTCCTYGHLSLPPKPVLITFDDGFADFLQTAVPIMQQFEQVSTLYITTNYVNKTSGWLAAEGEAERPMLTWAQVRQLPALGVECGAHTLTHPQLDLLLAADARREIERSKQVLEQQLGRRVESFAYPHGYFNGRVRQLVQAAGFTSACAVKHALSARRDDPFALARIIIAADTSMADFAQMLAGHRLRVAPQGEQLRTKAWRWKRRFENALRVS